MGHLRRGVSANVSPRAIGDGATGDRLAPIPTDVFDGAKAYLTGLPQSITDDAYNAERSIAWP